MYRRMSPKQLEELIKEIKEKDMNKEKDIVDILQDGGFGVVEGKDAVLAKIAEIGNTSPSSTVDSGLNAQRSSVVRLN